MPTQMARSPRDGSRIDLQSLHARYNQVAQIAHCLRVSIETAAEHVEPAAVLRAIGDLLDDINSDLWTYLEPALCQKMEAKAPRNAAMLRKRAHVTVDAPPDGNGVHQDSGALTQGADGEMTGDAAH